jgi:hypothetical protein
MAPPERFRSRDQDDLAPSVALGELRISPQLVERDLHVIAAERVEEFPGPSLLAVEALCPGVVP